ncbi:hypothetical protein [Dysgonomonas sp. 511]|uniref:hypothetical protein n=1 Tax=Dysgonomonas sp. 511 TaxID=2302930 RepID=UPI0013D37639|nr:hypothetical protein [Dysgonomonas sp. 511]NDV78877.1 hypothetical protein [Dysgonomonas sp. 511]
MNKYTTLLIALFFPLFATSQIFKPVTKREAEQIGKNTYVTSSGEVTKVVNTVKGLDEYASFLLEDPALDSVYTNMNSSYNNLEEATLEIDKLLREIDIEQKLNKNPNDALGFRLSQFHRMKRLKEKQARALVDKYISERRNEEPTVQELAMKMIKYGDKPTYYINGVEVPQSVTMQLNPSEVVKRELRVQGTFSGNPNGEIWYLVTDKALNRIKIPSDMALNKYDKQTVSNESSIPTAEEASEYLERITREAKKSSLKPMPVVKREYTSDGKFVDKTVSPEKKEKKKPEVKKPQTTHTQEQTTGTRVLGRTVNNQQVETGDREERRPAPQPMQGYEQKPAMPTKAPVETTSEVPARKQVDKAKEIPTEKPRRQEQNVRRESQTRVLTRTVNSPQQDKEREALTAPAPQRSAPSSHRSIPVVKRENKVEENKDDNTSPDGKPKRSVRRIKERHKQQNQD